MQRIFLLSPFKFFASVLFVTVKILLNMMCCLSFGFRISINKKNKKKGSQSIQKQNKNGKKP